MSRRIVTAALIVVTVGAAPASAQSLFSARGLGMPVAPLSARARALGGIGIGLQGLDASLVNPAGIVDVPGRGGVIGLQPFAQTVEYQGEKDALGATRFPLLRIVYPLTNQITAGVGYGTYLDRTWQVAVEGTAQFGGETVRTDDRITSSGGIGQARFTLGYAPVPSLAIGFAAGLYTGGVDRVTRRSFPDAPATGLEGFTLRSSSSFHGPLAVLGLRWDPTSSTRLGASVTWAGELTADSAGRSVGRFDMPWRASAGASAILAPDLSVALGGRWTGWESTEPAIGRGDAVSDTWKAGGGLEWEGASVGDTALPLRAGFHYAKLPFRLNGAVPTEWSAALGAGLNFGGDGGAMGALDVTIERGQRGNTDSTALSETFWRATFSLAVFGF